MEFIKNVATFISSLLVIIGAFATLNKWTKGKILEWLQKPVLTKLDEHNKRIDALEINNLKLIIMNDNIPLSERVSAGERYISLGGNGAIHTHYEVLKEEYKKQLNKNIK